jgi:cytochrome c553
VNISRFRFALFFLLLSVFLALRSSAHPQQAKTVPPKAKTTTEEAKEGEERFRTNCGRCHHPPEDLSPREARTVVRQMRIRAMLSSEDERLILKFLAP